MDTPFGREGSKGSEGVEKGSYDGQPFGLRVLKFDSAYGAEGYGIASGAALRPGFREFRRFCLPLAGRFKGLWIVALRQ